MFDRYHWKAWVACLCIAASVCLLFQPVKAAEGDVPTEKKLSDIATFTSIRLCYLDEHGGIEGEVGDRALIESGASLGLHYAYEIPYEKTGSIEAGVPYYLEVSPHLVLPDLKSGSSLTADTDEGSVEFGKIYADTDTGRAWIEFSAKADGSGTVLSEIGGGGLTGAYFYLRKCRRADSPPAEESPIEGKNLYAMKFENGEELHFGYAELEPVTAEAKIEKSGKQQDKTPTVTWTINYTPWQNPSAEHSDITMDTPFELVDTIDGAMHSFVKGSVKIDGLPVMDYESRDKIPADAQTYALIEETESGATLIIGGKELRAGEATAGKPAISMKITYDTVIEKELLLPGSAGDAGVQKIANAAELFAEKDGTFHKLGISGKDEVSIERPDWLKKEGKTTRHADGRGSTTDWTITFLPNGFTFTKDNALTFHDKLPEGSTLVGGSEKLPEGSTLAVGSVIVNGVDMSAAVTPEGDNEFAIPSIETTGNPVTITYQTTVPEEMYDSGTNLGENTAWFTFSYQDKVYTTPEAKTPVGSGDGSGKPGTATLVKENGGYHAKTRSIDWTVKINPHKAYLKSGTFVDDLGNTGGTCDISGHVGGLMLPNETIIDVTVQIDGQPLADADKDLVELQYDAQEQKLTIEVKEVGDRNVGARTITLQYTTKVCDPCIFANNTNKEKFVNEISTEDMVIGKTSSEPRSASAQSTVEVSANVLTKKAPVYDYKKGIMSWTMEVDAAELPMTGVILTDMLPEGLTYVDGSLHAKSAADGTELNANLTVTDAGPVISGADSKAAGQLLEIDLSENSIIMGKILVTFDTRVDPEKAGFNSDSDVTIKNTAFMTGEADDVSFAEVSHSVQQKFANHGLVKSSKTNNQKELIEYEVLINPFWLALPGNPSLVDTLDKRLQLDEDTLKCYEAELSGNSSNAGQKPGYTIKRDTEQSLKVADLDPVANSFTVKLPIKENSRSAYVLTYSADIMEREAGGYGNSVRFEGGSVKLGGEKQNSAPVSGGGGGGGGGVASRKVTITITQTDSITKKPLEGVAYTLYQWDSINNRRGLPVAQGITDALGRVSFKVKPKAEYVLVQTKGIDGYDQIPGWDELPEGASGGGGGILITAGTAGSGRVLELTNKADNSGGSDGTGDGEGDSGDSSGSTGDGGSGSDGNSGSTGNGNSGELGSTGSPDGSNTSGNFGAAAENGMGGTAGLSDIFSEDPGNMLQADGETGLRDQSGALSGRGVHSPQTGDDTSWRPNIFLVAIAVALVACIFYAVRKRKTEWTETDRDS